MSDKREKIPSGGPALSSGSISVSAAVDPLGATISIADPLVGQTIGERFQVTRLLGRGGMGNVYEAVQSSLGRIVAVKVLRADFDLTASDYERFVEEARLTAQLSHPNIVSVIEIGQLPDGRYFYVMEKLDGVTLSATLESSREFMMPIDRALCIARQICGVMAKVHERGVIHRDLKPENVFLLPGVSGEDFVKIVDFGVARLTDPNYTRRTVSGAGLGTPLYMSPEQVEGLETDGRTDIYALGAMLYEMLTGAAPYYSTRILEVLKRKATEDPPSMRSIRSEIPETLDRVVLCALARDPLLRYASMDEFAHALTKAMSDHSSHDPVDTVIDAFRGNVTVVTPPAVAPPAARISTRGNTETESAKKATRRRIFAGAVAAVLLVAVVVIALWSSGNGEVTTETPVPPQTLLTLPDYIPATESVSVSVSSSTPTDAGVAPRKARQSAKKADSKVSAQVREQELLRQVAEYKKAIRRNPRDRELRARLSALCRQLGDAPSDCK